MRPPNFAQDPLKDSHRPGEFSETPARPGDFAAGPRPMSRVDWLGRFHLGLESLGYLVGSGWING